MLNNSIRISIIVPVYNDPRSLRECLSALTAALVPASEIVVVDDASTDDSPAVAARMGARVLRLAKNSGPAAARNYGAKHARGDILFFVDADIVIAPEAVGRVVQALEENGVTAVFGSYDAKPRAKAIVSQYRNLLHHFVHQQGNPDASTFWAGCGAIRRSVFLEVGGFDAQRFLRASIEDIELGYRLRQAGHRILLDKKLQGTHLKKWTLAAVIRADMVCRAIPWSRLILKSEKAPNDLNLKLGQRWSVALVGLAGALLLFAPMWIESLGLVAAAILAVILINRGLFAFFFRQRGLLFAATCIPLYLLYYACCGLSYLYAWTDLRFKDLITAPPSAVERE